MAMTLTIPTLNVNLSKLQQQSDNDPERALSPQIHLHEPTDPQPSTDLPPSPPTSASPADSHLLSPLSAHSTSPSIPNSTAKHIPFLNLHGSSSSNNQNANATLPLTTPPPTPLTPGDPNPTFARRLHNLLTLLIPPLTPLLTRLAPSSSTKHRRTTSATSTSYFTTGSTTRLRVPTVREIAYGTKAGLTSPLLPLLLVFALAIALSVVAGWSLWQNLSEIDQGRIFMARGRELWRCRKGGWSCGR